jgi:hypothetical protein
MFDFFTELEKVLLKVPFSERSLTYFRYYEEVKFKILSWELALEIKSDAIQPPLEFN